MLAVVLTWRSTRRLRPSAGGRLAALVGLHRRTRAVRRHVVALSMLAQVLEQRGIGSRRVRHGAVARDVDRDARSHRCHGDVLVHVELTGSPAHPRYLVARLRERARHVPIVVGPMAGRGVGPPDRRCSRGSAQTAM